MFMHGGAPARVAAAWICPCTRVRVCVHPLPQAGTRRSVLFHSFGTLDVTVVEFST